MRGLRVLVAGVVASAVLLFAGAAYATQYWEIEPVKDAKIAVGTYAAVGGLTTPDCVNFTLKNNKDTMPLAVTLIAKAPAQPLHISVFKEEGSFLDKDTDASGIVTIRFRTADDVHFKVTGAAGSAYQLSLWRGPELAIPQSSPVVSMSSVVGAENGPAPAVTAGTKVYIPSGRAPAATTSGGLCIGIYLLLGGILIALAVIAFLIYR